MRCRPLGVVILVVPSVTGTSEPRIMPRRAMRRRCGEARRSAGRSTRPSGRLGLMRMRGNSGASPRSRPITPARSATATGCTRLPTTTAGCRWASPGPGACSGSGPGWATTACSAMAGTVAGQTIVGLGNTSLDMQSLYEELSAADGLDPVMPLPLCNVRGTSEASNFADLPDAVPRPGPQASACPCQVSRSARTLCEDIPAWWLLNEEADDLSPRRRRQPLGPDADAVPADPRQQRRVHQETRSRLRRHPRLPAAPRAARGTRSRSIRTLAAKGKVDLRADLRAVPRRPTARTAVIPTS